MMHVAMLERMSAYDLYRWAEGQFAERDYYGAAQALERLLEEHSDEADLDSARELLTRAYFHGAQLKKAEAAARDLLDRDPTHAYGAPRDPHQLGHRGLRTLRGQPGDLSVEAAGMTSGVTSPWHRPHRRAVLTTVHPRSVRLEPDRDRAEVQRPPPSSALTVVIARCPPTAPAAPPRCPTCGPYRGDQDTVVLVELDRLDNRLLDPQKGTP